LYVKTGEKCREWAEKSLDRRFRRINLKNIRFREDEAGKIEDGSLDYERIMGRELALLQSVREKFQAIDGNTY
jgi:hypothetical protein